MLAAIKWNSRHSAREWIMAVARVARPEATRQNRERTRSQPIWKHFDDTHHWDATAEEWVPNLDR